MTRDAKYLWIDLETTGLDPTECEILECAAIATDAELRQIGEPFAIVLHHAECYREYADAFVQDMHTTNGLWIESEASENDLYDLEHQLIDFIERFDWIEKKPILAGATVHFDRSFLAEQTAVVDSLHHRHLDVSSLKLAFKDAAGIPFAKAEAHRALADVRESLDQAREIYARIRRIGGTP